MNRRMVSSVVKAAVSLTLIWFLFRHRDVSWQALGAAVASPRWPWLAAAALAFTVSVLAGALQWSWILRAAGLATPRREMIRLYFVGLFFNNFLLGNVGGDAVKIVGLGRREGRTSAVFGGTVLDRLLGLCALTLLALMTVPMAEALDTPLPPTLPLWLALAIWTAGLAVLLSRRLAAGTARLLDRVRWPAAAERFRQVMAVFGEFRARPRWLLRLLFWSLGVQILRVATHILVAMGLGLALGTAHLLQFFVLVPLLGILIALPVSINGLGVREVAAADLFVAVGLVSAGSDAVAIEFLAYAVMVLVSLAGGVMFLTGPARPRTGGE